jgi:two-component system phosphate regulon sensor histidine kinase PhoR
MTQVVLNLLDNAWKYSRGVPEPGPVEVECLVSDTGRGELRPWRRGRPWVCIAVTDHGIGISKGDMRRLFRRFHRGKTAVSANVSGVGLGLAMCRHVVRRHGGRIEVKSEEGKGSTFAVWLTIPAPAGA